MHGRTSVEIWNAKHTVQSNAAEQALKVLSVKKVRTQYPRSSMFYGSIFRTRSKQPQADVTANTRPCHELEALKQAK